MGRAASAGLTVIKAFNAMFASYIAPDPKHAEGRQIVFYASDDEAARREFAAYVEHSASRRCRWAACATAAS